MAQFNLPTGELVLIDDADARWASEIQWRRMVSDGKSYVGNHVLVNGKLKVILLHRFVLGIHGQSSLGDHRNGNTLDNRKRNLRPCTHSENIRNQIRKQPSKTSMFKGVYWHKSKHKWAGQIHAGKKRHRLGYFSSEQQAAEAYNRAAVSLHGEFANLNHV